MTLWQWITRPTQPRPNLRLAIVALVVPVLMCTPYVPTTVAGQAVASCHTPGQLFNACALLDSSQVFDAQPFTGLCTLPDVAAWDMGPGTHLVTCDDTVDDDVPPWIPSH